MEAKYTCCNQSYSSQAPPDSVLTWLKDGVPLPSRAKISTQDDTSQLLIKAAQFTDSGIYTVELTSGTGKRETFSFQVQVTGNYHVHFCMCVCVQSRFTAEYVVGSELSSALLPLSTRREGVLEVQSHAAEAQLVANKLVHLEEGSDFVLSNDQGVSQKLKHEICDGLEVFRVLCCATFPASSILLVFI